MAVVGAGAPVALVAWVTVAGMTMATAAVVAAWVLWGAVGLR